MSTTRMRFGALLAAGALAFGLTACGDDSGGDTGADPPPATEEADPATETADAMAGDDVTEDFVARMSNATENMTSYEFTMNMQAGGESMEGSGAVDASGDSPVMEMMMTMPGAGEVEMILADERMFMTMPGMTQEGQYIEISSEMPGMENFDDQMKQMDVTEQMEIFQDAVTGVTEVGTEDIDGVEATEYEVTVDSQAIAEQNPNMDEQAESMLGDEVTYHIWIDADDNMRKMTFDLAGAATEMNIDNIGADVDVQIPADENIMQMDEMGGAPSGEG